MMTPVEEIEYVIRENATHEIDVIDPKYSYSIKSFPEICLTEGGFYYTVEILEDHRQSDDVIKRFEEFANEVNSRKITIENKTVYINRKFFLEECTRTLTFLSIIKIVYLPISIL